MIHLKKVFLHIRCETRTNIAASKIKTTLLFSTSHLCYIRNAWLYLSWRNPDSHLSDVIHQTCESFYQMSDEYHIHHVSKQRRPAGERRELLRQHQSAGDVHRRLRKPEDRNHISTFTDISVTFIQRFPGYSTRFTCVTLEHKNRHKGQMHTVSESWINNISIDVWFGQYLKIWNMRVQKNLNIEKIIFKSCSNEVLCNAY